MLNNLSKLHVYCFILSLATSVSYRYPENERFSRSNWPVLKLKHLNETRRAYFNIPNIIEVKERLYFAEKIENEMKKSFGSGGIRTHAPEETGALNQRLRPLGHATAEEVCFRYIKYACICSPWIYLYLMHVLSNDAICRWNKFLVTTFDQFCQVNDADRLNVKYWSS